MQQKRFVIYVVLNRTVMNSVNNKELPQLYEGSKLFVHVDNKNIPFELSYVMNIYLAITNIGILRRIERSIRVIRI